MAKETLTITDNRTGREYELPDRGRTDPRHRPPPDQGPGRRLRPDDLRPGLHEHGGVPERHHLHRRRRGDPPLPRLPDRAGRRAGQLPRDGLPADRGRAADRDAAPGVRTRTSATTPTSTRTSRSSSRASATTRIRWACCSAPSGRSRRSIPTPSTSTTPPTATLQRVRLLAKAPTIAAFAFRHSRGLPFVFPRQRPRLHRQLRQHDVQHRRAARAEQGAAAGARDPADPARRPRAELLDQRGARAWARRTSTRSRPSRAGIAALYGPLHGGANEAVLQMLDEIGDKKNVPAFIEEVKARRRPADGLRPPGLQVVRPAGQADQEGRRRRLRADRAQPEARDRARAGADRARGRLLRQAEALPERRFLLGAHLPGDGLSRPSTSPCCSRSAGCRAGWRSGRRCCWTRSRRSPGRARSSRAGTSARSCPSRSAEADDRPARDAPPGAAPLPAGRRLRGAGERDRPALRGRHAGPRRVLGRPGARARRGSGRGTGCSSGPCRTRNGSWAASSTSPPTASTATWPARSGTRPRSSGKASPAIAGCSPTGTWPARYAAPPMRSSSWAS